MAYNIGLYQWHDNDEEFTLFGTPIYVPFLLTALGVVGMQIAWIPFSFHHILSIISFAKFCCGAAVATLILGLPVSYSYLLPHLRINSTQHINKILLCLLLIGISLSVSIPLTIADHFMHYVPAYKARCRTAFCASLEYQLDSLSLTFYTFVITILIWMVAIIVMVAAWYVIIRFCKTRKRSTSKLRAKDIN
jgi:hypothetical protein